MEIVKVDFLHRLEDSIESSWMNALSPSYHLALSEPYSELVNIGMGPETAVAFDDSVVSEHGLQKMRSTDLNSPEGYPRSSLEKDKLRSLDLECGIVERQRNYHEDPVFAQHGCLRNPIQGSSASGRCFDDYDPNLVNLVGLDRSKKAFLSPPPVVLMVFLE